MQSGSTLFTLSLNYALAADIRLLERDALAIEESLVKNDALRKKASETHKHCFFIVEMVLLFVRDTRLMAQHSHNQNRLAEYREATQAIRDAIYDPCGINLNKLKALYTGKEKVHFPANTRRILEKISGTLNILAGIELLIYSHGCFGLLSGAALLAPILGTATAIAIIGYGCVLLYDNSGPAPHIPTYPVDSMHGIATALEAKGATYAKEVIKNAALRA